MKEAFVCGSRRYWIEVEADPLSELRVIRIESDDGVPGVELKAHLLGSSGRWRTFEFDGRIEDLLVSRDGRTTLVDRSGQTFEVQRLTDRDKLRAAGFGEQDEGLVVVKAHMPGKIVRLLCEPGEEVSAGDGLVVIEAMKMQNEIKSPKSGVLVKYLAHPGGNVNAGDPLCEVE